MEWQPIETAPQQGDILLFVPKDLPQIVVGHWMHSSQDWDYADEALSNETDWPGMKPEPTHWMPLLDPPKE